MQKNRVPLEGAMDNTGEKAGTSDTSGYLRQGFVTHFAQNRHSKGRNSFYESSKAIFSTTWYSETRPSLPM